MPCILEYLIIVCFCLVKFFKDTDGLGLLPFTSKEYLNSDCGSQGSVHVEDIESIMVNLKQKCEKVGLGDSKSQDGFKSQQKQG